ncbi:GNAT family N-acetyltransferase [Bacillus sp. DJP31]|uniref:GNAT family N-acetyltransferase n=1 Tax=Bacillus sp. DJP31 TaxID=3409789 RepID=UPI003BB623BA
MAVRSATPYEMLIINNHQSIVQTEATMGYIKQTDFIPNLNEYFHGLTDYFVLVENGVFCGWVLVGETHHPYKNKEACAMVLELYIFKNYRQYGFGHELMKHAIADFKNRGFKSVQLNVFEGNPAKKLYSKLGFKDISTMMEKTL